METWILILTLASHRSVAVTQVAGLSEGQCRHYEAQYNAKTHDFSFRWANTEIGGQVNYRAQCIKTR